MQFLHSKNKVTLSFVKYNFDFVAGFMMRPNYDESKKSYQ